MEVGDQTITITVSDDGFDYCTCNRTVDVRCVDGVSKASALVFLSSTKSDAALGGPRGADQTCVDLARAAGLGGYWFSWTSDACTSPSQRFEQSTLPYRMVDGTEISPSWESG